MADITDIHGKPLTGEKPKRSRGKGGLLDARGLTAKEEAYAQLVAKGEPMSEAYRRSYEAQGMKPSRVWNRAHSLSIKPKVQHRIGELLRQHEQDSLHDPARIRAFVLERLQIEAKTADAPGARVAALGLLGKVDKVRLFRDLAETEIIDNREADALKAELEARLLKRSETA